MRSALLTGIITGTILLFLLLATLVVARSLVLPLRRLRAGALDIATSSLPARVRELGEASDPSANLDVEPIAVHSTDEIGQVARALVWLPDAITDRDQGAPGGWPADAYAHLPEAAPEGASAAPGHILRVGGYYLPAGGRRHGAHERLTTPSIESAPPVIAGAVVPDPPEQVPDAGEGDQRHRGPGGPRGERVRHRSRGLRDDHAGRGGRRGPRPADPRHQLTCSLAWWKATGLHR